MVAYCKFNTRLADDSLVAEPVFALSVKRIGFLDGRLYSVDWTRDWTVGLDCGTGLRKLRS